MNRNIKRILLLVVFAGLVGGGVAVYMYNKPHKNILKAAPAYTLAASELINAYETDEKSANEKYLGTILEVNGTIANVSFNETGSVSIYLEDEMFGVTGTFDSEVVSEYQSQLSELTPGQAVTIKGRCDGLLTDVRLSKCYLINK